MTSRGSAVKDGLIMVVGIDGVASPTARSSELSSDQVMGDGLNRGGIGHWS